MDKQSKILIIYTGGTIGMVKNHKTGSLVPLKFKDFYNYVPELNRISASLDYYSFQEPIDSSEMNPKIWKSIAEEIYKQYNNYDGFVILHGSDTIAYTASALSFMLQGISKPIILTGSQLPIGIIRTDGKENLITAIEIAALKDKKSNSIIKDVAIYFEYSLYRGNRASKISANHFEAIDSPNYQKLASAGVEITFNRNAFYKSKKKKLEPFFNFDSNVAIIKLYPGIKWNLYKSLFEKSKAVIMETFGSGNTSTNKYFIQFLKQYILDGGIVINKTQCLKGKVEMGKYETSNELKKIGVISAKDMTIEATITKIMYLLGKEKKIEKVKKMFQKKIVGELTN